jgi:hypothetical protein
MGIGQNSVAAATAVVGYDLATGQMWQQSSVDRALTGFGMRGSAASGDTKVSIYVDTVKVAEFYNAYIATATIPNQDDIVSLDGNFVPSGGMIHIYVDDAPATNPINIILTWDEVEVE